MSLGSKEPRFRGVTKNKYKLQIINMIHQKKVYNGDINSELEAAQYYDRAAILKQGLSTKTNFAYCAI